MNETYHIGILLNGSRFTQVTQLRTFTFFTFTALHTTIQLRQGYNRNIQLLRQTFQRTRNGTYLFLTTTKRHTTCIHQLQVVDNNNPHSMLTHQTAGFCAKLKYRQRRSIIHIQRRIQKVTQFIVQLLPFIIRQLSTLDFLTWNFARIGYQTIYQLYVTHFKRKHSYRIAIIHRNILCHRKHERRLTHCRTGSNNNKVGSLPTGSHLIKFGKTTLQTTQTISTGSCNLN